MKVLVSCANGAGTSLMMKMKVQQALKDLNVNVEKIHHCSISEGKATVIRMKNILSVDEAKTRMKEAGLV